MQLKVNELAKRIGLSIRALHHYDHIGLLRPSTRSEKGYRLYSQEDVIRLHKIQTLKQLGFSLSDITSILADAKTSSLEIITQQIDALDKKIHHAQALRNRLNHLKEKLAQGADPKQADWLAILEMMNMYEKHFSKDEIQRLRSRWEEAERDLDTAWHEAVQAVQKAMDAGEKPTSETARKLGRQWVDLLRETTGNDPALVRKLKLIHEEESRLRELSGVNSEMIQWISLAIAEMRAATAAEPPSGEAAVVSDQGEGSDLRAHPKPTALIVASYRAAHQLLDAPLVFEDPLACRILGEAREQALRDNLSRFETPLHTAVRTAVVVRSKLAENEWRVSRERGTSQHVILGAGLDTFAYRNQNLDGCRIFEVDLPATQQWKRDHLRAAAISEPAWLTFVPIDFDSESLADALKRRGFRLDEPAFFSWLGVTMYLEEEAVANTLAFIGSLAPGSGVAFDYLLLPELLSEKERAAREFLLKRTAEYGEPQKTFFDPPALVAKLRALGFGEVRDLDSEELAQNYLSGRTDGLRLGRSSRIMVARV